MLTIISSNDAPNSFCTLAYQEQDKREQLTQKVKKAKAQAKLQKRLVHTSQG
jgi:hypothetical protein